MAVEAPLSRYKKNNLVIFAAVLSGLAVWLYYDGHYNKAFIKTHTDPQGGPDSTLNFNRQSPPFLLAGAALVAGYFFHIKNRKVVAGESCLLVNGQAIAYGDVQSIDKTYFDKKGFFIINYNLDGQSRGLKLSDRIYDNLPAVLDCLVEKIST